MSSSELERIAEQLRTFADRLDGSAGRHDAAIGDLGQVLSDLGEHWRSPDADAFEATGRTLVADLGPVPGAVEDAAGHVRALASTTSGLATELAAEERAREAAQASARQAATRATSADPDDAALVRSLEQQHQQAVHDRRRAEVAIEEIGARWWAACEGCAAEVQGATEQVLAATLTARANSDADGSSNAALPARLASALAAWWAQRALAGGQLTVDGDHAIVTGTDGSDYVELVEQDGRLYVRISNLVDGELTEVAYHQVPGHVRTLTVRTGSGHDVVSVPPGVAEHIELTFNVGSGNNVVGYVNPDASIMSVSGGDGLRVLAGDGDNTIHGTAGDDTIVVGGGDNNISGVAGANLISAMGGGNNRIIGGTGDDRIRTGDGNDYIDGGDGRDHVETSGGRNVLAAGEGDGDRLIGGDGRNTFVGGRGSTHVSSSGEHDRFLYTDLDQHRFDRDSGGRGGRLDLVRVEVDGRPGEDAIRLERPSGLSDAEWDAWANRVETDLEMLRHTPAGAAGLGAMDDDVGRSGPFWNRQPAVTVQPLVDRDADFNPENFDVEGYLESGRLWSASFASSSDGVFYATDGRNSQSGDQAVPSAITLYHELSHAYDHRTGAIDELRQVAYDEVVLDADGNEVARRPLARRSDGRPFTAEINSVGYDQDGDGRLSDDETLGNHPAALTEFEVRRDLGLDPRPGYLTDPGDVPEGGRVVYEERED